VFCVIVTLLLLFFVRGLLFAFLVLPFLPGIVRCYYDAIEIIVEPVCVHFGKDKTDKGHRKQIG
jgi:hypothetical protein